MICNVWNSSSANVLNSSVCESLPTSISNNNTTDRWSKFHLSWLLYKCCCWLWNSCRSSLANKPPPVVPCSICKSEIQFYWVAVFKLTSMLPNNSDIFMASCFQILPLGSFPNGHVKQPKDNIWKEKKTTLNVITQAFCLSPQSFNSHLLMENR